MAALLLSAAAPRAADPDLNARLFDRAWEEVDRRYWNRARLGEAWDAARERYRERALAAPDGAALYAILGAMLAEVGDSHVYAVPPDQVAFDAAGDQGGERAEYGFASWPMDGAMRVLSVRQDSPAARAGVRPGWILSAIEGHALDDNWHPDDGERTRFRFVDAAGQARTIDLVSTLLPPQAKRRETRLPGNVLLLGFDIFEGGEARWIAERIAGGPPPAAVILDLRENEGGEAREVARVAGRFFDRRRTLLTRLARGKAMDVPLLSAGREAYRGPLAVLVGPRSASGAEVLAALVQESGRGTTVGETTAGAVTGAALETLPDGGELWIAVFDIRSAGGTRLEAHGFTPAHVVRPTLADLRAGRDPVLDAARAWIGTGARAAGVHPPVIADRSKMTLSTVEDTR